MEDSKTDGIGEYYRFLAGNRPYRLLMLGEIVNQAGAWANFIATMDLVNRLGGGSALLVSGVVIVRVLPSLIFFPVAGVVADRFNRVGVLIITALLSAGIVCGLTLVRTAATLWLMFALLLALFSVASFIDPARRALTPQLVPPHQLHLAATLDASTWSIMAAVGASLGGLLVSRLGTTACFWIDAATYMVSAAVSVLILRTVDLSITALPEPPAAFSRSFDSASSHADMLAAASEKAGVQKGFDGQGDCAAADREVHSSSGSHRHRPAQQSAGEGLSPAAGAASAADVSIGSGSSGRGMWQQGVSDLQEGWDYMTALGNRDVAAQVWIKASGAFVWGASDVLYVKFSDVPAMQIRDSATTMGVLFACMGLGAFLGPVIFNRITPSQKPYLLRSCAFSFASLALGYALMTVAPGVGFLLPATVVRSIGSAALWIYSTLLLQFRVPNAIQGRVFALEMAFYVSTESLSGLWGGFMFDNLRLSPQRAAGVMSVIATINLVTWASYAWKHWTAGSSGSSSSAGYELVPSRQQEADEPQPDPADRQQEAGKWQQEADDEIDEEAALPLGPAQHHEAADTA